jgi:hypothetical protein
VPVELLTIDSGSVVDSPFVLFCADALAEYSENPGAILVGRDR